MLLFAGRLVSALASNRRRSISGGLIELAHWNRVIISRFHLHRLKAMRVLILAP